MAIENTPRLETERLVLRRFTPEDVEAVLAVYGDEQANRFLPWFALRTREDAEAFLHERFLSVYDEPHGYAYAVCLRGADEPIGHVKVDVGGAFDFGYAFRHEYWHRGIATEAARAVLDQLRRDGVPFVTATHDVNNPHSGAVMRKLGMRYRYSYEEQWQPKDELVTFRLYQLNLDGNEGRTWRAYALTSPRWFIESGV